MRSGRVYGVLLSFLVVVAYANNLSGPFFFDDLEYIVHNPYIRSLRPSVVLGGVLSARPVVNISLAANYAIGGLDVRGYHVINIFIHACNTILLFALVLRTLRATRSDRNDAIGIAFPAAALWSVHPLQTESVNYVMQRSEMLGGFFYLLTLYAAARGIGRRLDVWQAVAIVACFLGMATKQLVITAPFMVLVYDRCFITDSFGRALAARPWLYAGLAASLPIVPSLMLFGLQPIAVGWWQGVGPLEYALNQARSITLYLRLVVWPSPLLIDYGEPVRVTVADVWPELGFIVALVLATLLLLARRPRIGFLAAWFFVILAPSSSFIPIVTEVAAERRMYLPLAGLVALFVIAVRRWRPDVVGSLGAILLLAIGAAWTSRTMARNAEYADPAMLWRAAVAAFPDNFRAHNNLGATLASRGEYAEAIREFREALRLKPEYAKETRGNLERAIHALERQTQNTQ